MDKIRRREVPWKNARAFAELRDDFSDRLDLSSGFREAPFYF